jgi:hypothetical protein
MMVIGMDLYLKLKSIVTTHHALDIGSSLGTTVKCSRTHNLVLGKLGLRQERQILLDYAPLVAILLVVARQATSIRDARVAGIVASEDKVQSLGLIYRLREREHIVVFVEKYGCHLGTDARIEE